MVRGARDAARTWQAEGMTRLFVAVWPPPEVRAVLAALDRPAIPGVRWSAPEQWMVKVRPLGHVGDWVVPALIDVLEAELDGAPAVECVLGPAMRRVGGQWLHRLIAAAGLTSRSSGDGVRTARIRLPWTRRRTCSTYILSPAQS